MWRGSNLAQVVPPQLAAAEAWVAAAVARGDQLEAHKKELESELQKLQELHAASEAKLAATQVAGDR